MEATKPSRRRQETEGRYRNVYDAQALEALRSKLQAAGQQIPHNSLLNISYHRRWGGWRVMLPSICGKEVTYFFFSDYGGPEAALLEAQTYRDDAFAKVGLDPFMRLRDRCTKRERGDLLSIWEAPSYRGTNEQFIIGSWMAMVDGKVRQRKVSRAFGRARTRQQAWDQVEAIVRAGVAAEAERRKALCGLTTCPPNSARGSIQCG